MNALGSAASLMAQATLDGEDRLIFADPAIDALNARAGGALGERLAVPQLATAVRLARRLGVPVSRAVVVADEDIDLDLWVRAQPEGGQVRLAVTGWRVTPAWQPESALEDVPLADADWRWETDASLRVTAVSLEAAVAAGMDAAALLGQPLTALFALEDSGQDGALPILDGLARQRPFADQTARLRASGRLVLLSATVKRDGAAAFAGLRGAARLIETATPAEPALPVTFTSGLDRALRSPLARIVANADSMSAQADGPIAPAYADYAADIAGAGRHLLALIDDLIDLQAVERPDFALPVETIDLADVARRAAGLLGVRAADAQVTIARPDMGVTIGASGDFRRSLQIAVNLLGNALRYSPARSTVEIETRREGARALLIVTDRGKGIAAADQARIFDKFGRVDPGEEGGNGLGLYIARRLARAMAGDLTVESTPGTGARFTLALAAAPDGRA